MLLRNRSAKEILRELSYLDLLLDGLVEKVTFFYSAVVCTVQVYYRQDYRYRAPGIGMYRRIKIPNDSNYDFTNILESL